MVSTEMPSRTESAVFTGHRVRGQNTVTVETEVRNKREAFAKCVATPEFMAWHRNEVARRLGTLGDIEQRVNDAMRPENLLIEVLTD